MSRCSMALKRLQRSCLPAEETRHFMCIARAYQLVWTKIESLIETPLYVQHFFLSADYCGYSADEPSVVVKKCTQHCENADDEKTHATDRYSLVMMMYLNVRMLVWCWVCPTVAATSTCDTAAATTAATTATGVDLNIMISTVKWWWWSWNIKKTPPGLAICHTTSSFFSYL